MANRYGDIPLPFGDGSVITTTYKYSVPKSDKTHRLSLNWSLVSGEAGANGANISIEDFSTTLNNAVLDNGFLQLMGNEVRVNWLVIEPHSTAKTSTQQTIQHTIALNGKYGRQLEPVEPLRGFHFTIHHSGDPRPTNLYVRGVPKSFDSWDKDQTMHNAVESCCAMLISDLPLGPLSIRYVLPHTSSYRHDFLAPDAVNGHGTRLFSSGKKPEKKPQPNASNKKRPERPTAKSNPR